MGFGLSAVHVNHRLRPGAAEGDAVYAEALCRSLGADFYGFEREVATLAAGWGVSEEEAGRIVRYEAFDEAARAIAAAQGLASGQVRVAVAQNRNDQAETVLMRLLRGSGTDGLAAMPYIRRGSGGFDIIRPLLDTDRASIEGYCRLNGLEPRIDHTNKEAAYRRNRIRLELMPLLERGYNSNIVDTLARLASNAAEDRDYFGAATDRLLEEYGVFEGDGGGMRLEFPREEAAKLHPALRHRLFVKCFERIGLVQDIEAAHLRVADHIAGAAGTGKTAEFPGGYRLTRRYGTLVFYNAGAPVAGAPHSARSGGGPAAPAGPKAPAGPAGPKAPAAPAAPAGSTAPTAPAGPRHSAGTDPEALCPGAPAPAGHTNHDIALRALLSGKMETLTFEQGGLAVYIACTVREELNHIPKSAATRGRTAIFDYESLIASTDCITIRTRQPGDWMSPEGMQGRKKIQDIFVDAKLPAGSRGSTPLAAIGDEIICILAEGRLYRKTQKYAINEETKRIFVLEYAIHA
jgi:tRNA(Ile)-lysidine synthetase-like protein